MVLHGSWGTNIMENMPSTNQVVDDSTFRSAIQQQLRSDGVYDEITARLRANILLSLCNPKAKKSQVDHGLEEMAWQSLVYHFLAERNFVHTLSVYSAECGMECRSFANMSLEDCMKALGLSRFWNQLKKKQNDGRDDENQGGISMLLRFVAHVFAPDERYSDVDRKCVSVSVQTESGALSASNGNTTENEYIEQIDHHHTSLTKKTAMKSMEQRIIEIEHDLRHEMNEKLRLSAKKQAIHVTRRLEEEHREEVKRMQSLIDAERVKSQEIETEWTEKFALLKLAMEKERSEMGRKLEMVLLAKETLESDISLMHDTKKKQIEERARELDAIDEQKRRLQSEINEAIRQQDAIKAIELRCASLQCEQDTWLSEREELLNEIKLLHKQLTSSRKAKDIVEQSLAQLKSDYLKQSQTHRMTENSLQSQLQKLEGKYQKATSDLENTGLDLETARNEVTSLHSLLSQTKSALESVTFRGEDDSFKRDHFGFRTTDFRHLLQSKVSRNSIGVSDSSRAPPLSTPSFRPKTSSSVLQRSAPDSFDGSSCSFENTTFKLLGAGSDAEQRNGSFMPQVDSEGHQTRRSIVKPVDNIHQTRVDNQTIPEDPPCCFAGDPPDGTSLVQDDKARNENMCQSMTIANFLYEQRPRAKKHHALENPMNAIIHEQHDDDVSALSGGIGLSDFATEQAYSSEVVELSDESDRADSNATQHEQSDPYEEMRNFSNKDEDGTSLRESKDKKVARNNVDSSTEMPLSLAVTTVPNTTFMSDQYSESFQSENEKNAIAAGERETQKSNEYEIGKQVGTDSCDNMIKNYCTHNMTDEPATTTCVESEESYPQHREVETADFDTPRSISSTSSNAYSASFYTED
eukprot:CCRYP_011886-RA/>CCRYP_011886-RA protein AED:0.01 eAED:0.01 QI:658/1/1/1/0.33/0.25/4/630/863